MRRKYIAWFLTFALAASACSRNNSVNDPQVVIDEAMKVHGVSVLDSAVVDFDFRDRQYVYENIKGKFRYKRHFTDTLERAVEDILTNNGLVRLVNGDTVDLLEEKATAYANSVNSVMYFAFLPYKLNDAAVKKQYIGTVQVEGKPYHKIKVEFEQEGGGEDFEDTFIYWIHKDSSTVDYLAYEYHVEGGGMRFRKAYNPRTIRGLRIQDYVNYQPKNDGAALLALDSLYEAGALEELSRIELENVKID